MLDLIPFFYVERVAVLTVTWLYVRIAEIVYGLPLTHQKLSMTLDWSQCGNSLELSYMELPDSLWMNCKAEFGVMFWRCSPR